MNDERSVWCRLLGVGAPWTVVESRVDEARRQCEVSIALEAPRGWFGLSKRIQPATRELSWRHVNFGNWDVRVSLMAPADVTLDTLPWTGEPELPFTRELSQQVFAYLREGCSLQSICTLLRLPIAELWRFRYAIDNGRWLAGDVVATPSPVAVVSGESGMEAVAGTVVATGGGVPDVSDPVWLDLVHGSRALDIRVLGLRLLLSRLRTQFEVIADDEVRLLKLQELHRYFVKNRRLLAHELAQLEEA